MYSKYTFVCLTVFLCISLLGCENIISLAVWLQEHRYSSISPDPDSELQQYSG